MRLSIYRRHMHEIAAFVHKVLLPLLREVADALDEAGKTWHHWSDDAPISDGALKVYLMTSGKSPTTFCNSIVVGVDIGIIQVMLGKEAVWPESDNPGNYNQDYSAAHIERIVAAIRRFDRDTFIAACEADALAR